ncbi:MAG TPA: protein kinase [Kofleriaceae bacterium]|nr:protein kinase [Kofleriaceae bacterium]
MAERQFGPYRLVRQIAVGGMAEIHLAKTRGIAGFEKYVALKMIHPNFAQDDQFIQMLIDEAKIAVQLQHVNVAQTFDLGRVGDTYYITMEFVDGADLYKILRRGSEQDLDLPLDVCAFVAKEAATGLDYAHRKKDVGGRSLGIVHRDISPQNVLVSFAGEVKLVDFGIAKATMKARQTAVGVIKGKYYYMSPEQAWGDPLDHRSDIFSAGIVLYEMITGQMLYLEEDIHKLLDMVRRANIAPPSTLRQGVPPQLERIVMHALAKNANDRYQSAGDMASDLERFLHTYSPVFTASKLSAHLRKVLGDPQAAPAPAPAPVPEKRNPNLSTQPIDRGELVRDHSEFTDENSVIFRVNDLKAKDAAAREQARLGGGDFDEQAPTSDELPARAPARAPSNRPAVGRPPTSQPPMPAIPRTRAPTAPPPMKIPAIKPVAPAPARKPTAPIANDYSDSAPTNQPMPNTAPIRKQARIDEPTMQVNEHDLSDIEEMTMVTAPPAFGGGGESLAEMGDYEPTMIEREPGSPHDDDGGPTTTREPGAMPIASAADSHAHTAPVMPGGGRLRPAPPGAPAHPALSAKNPTPAVSAIKQAKPSRRTPAQGSPAVGPSVLQSIVNAQSSEPMPTRQLRGIGGPSDGVPAQPLPDHASSTSMTNPDAGRGAIPPDAAVPQWMPGPPPGANVLPQPPIYQQTPQAALPHNQLPPHLQPYAMQQPPPPGAVSPLPLGAPMQTPYPFLPYPSQPQTFTKQLAALEADEIPAHLRLGANRPNWLLRALLALAIIGGGVAVGLLVLRSQNDASAKASLLIDSVPPGATVIVDGVQLKDPTPVVFTGTQAGARHTIELRLKGKKTWSDTVVVPAAGGEVQVKPFLQSMTVTLHVTSTPPGAEVYFNEDEDHPQGRTPLDVPGLDPSAVKQVKLKLAGYAPETATVDFADASERTVAVTLHK